MSRYSNQLPKKKYFTQSQTNLASIHPREQFVNLIKAKKQYQSLIKQELNALEAIQNAQIKQLNQWQVQLESQNVEIGPFKAYQSPTHIKPHSPRNFQIPAKQEKLIQEVRLSYDKLRLISMQKNFELVLSKLQYKRKSEVKKRASNFLYHQTLAQKYFKVWLKETYPVTESSINLKQKIFSLTKYRQRPFFACFTKYRIRNRNIVKIKEVLNNNHKILFLHSLSDMASRKYVQATADEQIQKLLKIRGLLQWKKFHEKQKRIQSLEEKKRLLENIYCHRKLNSFFSQYRQSKFKKEHNQITSNILNRIDLLQIVNQTQEPFREQNQQNDSVEVKQRQGSGPKVNATLLNLILENFIQQYSQEYDYTLNEQEFSQFLHELKTQCVRKVINNYRKSTVFQALSFHKKVKYIISINKQNQKRYFVSQLHIHRNIQYKKNQINILLRQNNGDQFLFLLTTFIQHQKSIKQLKSSKIISKLLIKSTLSCLKRRLSDVKIYQFKKSISNEWRKSHICKLVIKSIKKYNELYFDDNSENEYEQSNKASAEKISNDYSQTKQPCIQEQKEQYEKKWEIINTPEKQPQKQEDEYESLKFSRAKHQLSKIVNVISKGVGPKSTDSYKRSADSQSYRPTITRLKTESDQRQLILEDQQLQQQRQCFRSKQNELLKNIKAMKCKRLFKVFQGFYQIKLHNKQKNLILDDQVKFFKNMRKQKTLKQSFSLFFITMSLKIKQTQLSNLIANNQCDRISKALRNFIQLRNLKRKQQNIEVKVKQIHANHLLQNIKINRQMSHKRKQLNSLVSIYIKKQSISCLKELIISSKLNNFSRILKKIYYNTIAKQMISIFKQIHDQQAHNSIQKRQQNREQVQEEEPSHLQNIIGFEQQENQIIEEKNISQQFISPEKQQENSQNIMNYLYTPENQNNSSHYQQQEEQQIETKFNQKQSSPQPQQGYEENEEEEEEQEGDWLTHKLQNNQLKRLIEYSNYNRFFKSFKKYNFKPSQAIIQPQAKSIDLDKEDESTEIKIKQIESIMKRRVIMNIIASIQAKEQEKIKSEEYEQIIKFTIAKREKQLIKKAFEGLFTVVEDKWGNKVKQLCFTGWLSHIKQKKMLKEYLKMQAAGQENRSTYYAQTIQDKQAFQRLRDLI